MADKKHLEILQRGVEVWNQWREDNPDAKPILSFVNLYGSNLEKVNLSQADLYGANLEKANLSQANLYFANLGQANLEKANLSQANLYSANLGQANLEKANLYCVNLEGSIMVNANLKKANLIGANLEDIVLVNANLEKANLSKVRALITNFEGAILTGACIEDWNINNQTNFRNVQCDYIFLKKGYYLSWRHGYSDRRVTALS